MNLNVYLPDDIAQAFLKHAEHKHLNKSAAVRQAVENWIQESNKAQWPENFFRFKAVAETPDFTKMRDELLPPKEVF
jgi:post-segregation antitoxin (ccd killing protein)